MHRYHKNEKCYSELIIQLYFSLGMSYFDSRMHFHLMDSNYIVYYFLIPASKFQKSTGKIAAT